MDCDAGSSASRASASSDGGLARTATFGRDLGRQWGIPDLPAVRPLLERLAQLVEAGGTLLLLAAKGFAEMSPGEQLYPPRAKRWAEFDRLRQVSCRVGQGGAARQVHTCRTRGRGAEHRTAAPLVSRAAEPGSARHSLNHTVSNGPQVLRGTVREVRGSRIRGP